MNINFELSHPAEKAFLVQLCADKKSTLDWQEPLDLTEKMIQGGAFILWELDFGLSAQDFIQKDEVVFLSMRIVIEQFLEKVWQKYPQQSLGLVLHREKYFSIQDGIFSKWIEEKFKQEKKAFSKKNFFQKLLYSEVVVDFFSQLTFLLPDELKGIYLFDFTEMKSISEQFFFFSQKQFDYFLLGTKNAKLPYSALSWKDDPATFMNPISVNKASYNEKVGVLFPNEVDFSFFHQFDHLFKALEEKRISYRILPQRLATEKWEGLDILICMKKALDEQGERILLGFLAAGGEVVYVDEKIDIAKAISLKQFFKQ